MISITVIPNKNRFNIPEHYEETTNSSHHHDLLIDYAKRIGLKYDTEDIYKSYIQNDFCVIITSTYPISLIAVYLPDNVNQEQIDYLKSIEAKFYEYEYIDLFTYLSDIIDISISPGRDKSLMLAYFYDELNKICVKGR